VGRRENNQIVMLHGIYESPIQWTIAVVTVHYCHQASGRQFKDLCCYKKNKGRKFRMPCQLINVSSKLAQWNGTKSWLARMQVHQSNQFLTNRMKPETNMCTHLLCNLCLSHCFDSGSRDVPTCYLYVRGAPSALNTGAGVL